VTAAVAAVVLVAAIGYWVASRDIHATSFNPALASQYIYTARTANDAAIMLPDAVQGTLRQAGQAHQSIELTQVGYTGNVTMSYIDMTPRTGNSPQDPVLKINGRALPVIDAKITSIQQTINSSPVTTGGGRALYLGLTRTDFTGGPVTIISSGIDLTDPDDFRSLKWSVPPGQVVAAVRKAGALPAMHGPVTFVVVPTAGRQPQLEQAQKDYLKSVWTALLTAAGATSVTFIDADGTTAAAAAPSAPVVALPSLPTTPIPQVRGPGGVTCTLLASYFKFKSAQLVDPAKTVRDLTPCITAALDARATFALDGWASYEGPLDANGQPATHYADNLTLSQARVETIANLLVNDLGVPQADLTRMTGHGDYDLPNPDPSSAGNRVVRITYHIS
jgi:hypothetical protein